MSACQKPPPEVHNPAMVRVLPAIPGLTQQNGVYSFVSARAKAAATVHHSLQLDGYAVLEMTTPADWSVRRVGNAAWFSWQNGRARLIVFRPVRMTHQKRIADFHDLDMRQRRRISRLESLDSPRRPYLYTIAELSDGRSGLVYAILTDPNVEYSGVVATGMWPAALDEQFRTAVLRAVNTANYSRPK